MAQIHSTAIVDPDAKLGEGVIIGAYAIVEAGVCLGDNVSIGPYTLIRSGVKIGNNTKVDSHAVIEGDTTIGENNKFHSFVSIGKEPQDLKHRDEKTKTVIGNNNCFREFVTMHRGTSERWETCVGDNNLFLCYVHLAHDVKVGNGCIFSNNATLAGHVTVEDFVIIGGLTPVHQFARIGSYSMIGGACAISQDIPPFSLAIGNPASVRGLNTIGLSRRNFLKEDISILKKAHRLFFRSGLPQSEALEEMLEQYGENKFVKQMHDFILDTKRGIAR